MQQQVYRQVVATLQERDSSLGITVGMYGRGAKNPYWNSLVRLNIRMGELTTSSEARHAVLSELVDRPIITTYSLTVAEVIAFNRLQPLSIKRN